MTTNRLLSNLPPMATVAKILEPRRLVISRGATDEVKIGQTYLVYGLGERLKDPVDGRDLGQLEIVRGRGKVVHVQERMATIESIETERSRVRKVGGVNSLLSSMMDETVTEMPFHNPEIGDLCRPV